jgi:N-acetylneuraminic acid mutarotase
MSHSLWLYALTVAASLGAVACGEGPTQPDSAGSPAVASVPSAVASETWVRGANIPGPRHRWFASAGVPNAGGQSILYAIGGCEEEYTQPIAKVQAYNVATDTWTRKQSLPTAMCGMNGGGVIGGKIYVSGGYHVDRGSPSRALYRFDPIANSWTRRRDMPQAGYAGVTGVIKSRLYVYTARQNSSGGIRNGFFRYDPASDQWASLPLPSEPGASHQYGVGGVINDRLYVLGGVSSHHLDVYDPATNRWTTVAADLPIRSEAGAAVVREQLHVFGGRVDGELVATMSAYDPVSATWTAKTPHPYYELYGMRFHAITLTKVFLDGQARIQVLSGQAYATNWAYVP